MRDESSVVAIVVVVEILPSCDYLFQVIMDATVKAGKEGANSIRFTMANNGRDASREIKAGC